MHESDSRSRSSVASPDDVTHEMQRMSSPKKSTGSATLSPVDDWRKAVDSTGFAATGTLRLRRPVAYQQIRPIYDVSTKTRFNYLCFYQLSIKSSGVMTAATENHEIGNSPPTDCTSPAQFPTARLVSPPSLSFTYDHSQDPTMSPPVMLSPSLSSARANSPFAQATPSSRRSSASYVHDFSSPNIQPTSPLAAEMDISTTADDSSAADFMSAISNMTVQRSDRFNVGSEDGSDFDVLSVRSGSHFDLDGTASEASLSSWASARNQ